MTELQSSILNSNLQEQQNQIIQDKIRDLMRFKTVQDSSNRIENPTRLIKTNKSKLQAQHSISIGDLNIHLPYKPYEQQVVYMSHVIKAIQNSQIAALESPTGTGKTLSLLCASLSWLQNQREQSRQTKLSQSTSTPTMNPPPLSNTQYHSNHNQTPTPIPPIIYYASRTHSQLSNVIRELRKTPYEPQISQLASRNHTCVNSTVRSSQLNIDLACKRERAKRACKYHLNVENAGLEVSSLLDIEEMNSMGKKKSFCPFYVQRKLHKSADIVFLPYNYLLDQRYLKSMEISIRDNIVIIDEGHNIDSVCEDSMSFCISTLNIDDFEADLKSLRKIVDELVAFDVDMLDCLIDSLASLRKYLNHQVLDKGDKRISAEEFFDILFKGSKQFTLSFESTSSLKSGLRPENLRELIDFLSLCQDALSDRNINTSLEELIQILSRSLALYVNHRDYKMGNIKEKDYIANSFRFILQDVDERLFTGKDYISKKVRKLSIFCLNPGFGFQKFLSMKPRSVILTSGTLFPITRLESELKVKFPILLENKHVISPKQVKLLALGSFPKEPRQFIFNRDSRSNHQMISDLGATILDFCKITKGGVLVFFASYNFVKICTEVWEQEGITGQIAKFKELFVDNKPSVLAEYRKSVSEGRGALLLSVCRGSISEGVDFPDDLARLVVIVGVPYPNLGDIKVILKKEYLRHCKMNSALDFDGIRKLSDDEWYRHNAVNSINQAMGRVIRHSNDYGAICLVDRRYFQWNEENLSSWLRGIMEKHDGRKCYGSLIGFFKDIKELNKKTIQLEKRELLTESRIVDGTRDLSTADKEEIPTSTVESRVEKAVEEKPGLDGKERTDSLSSLAINRIEESHSQNRIQSEKNSQDSFLKRKRDKPADSTIKSNTKRKNQKLNDKAFPSSLSQHKINKFFKIDQKEAQPGESIRKECSPDSQQSDKSPLKEHHQDSESIPDGEKANLSECAICYSLKKDFLVSKCCHSFCMDCWEQLLSQKLECPLCKKKVRRETLARKQ